MNCRSYLYVPGDRNDRLGKALSRNADALILDLEDAVLGKDKEVARRNVRQFLLSQPKSDVPIWVRLNQGRERSRDLEMTADLPRLTGYIPAKVENAGELEQLDDALSSMGSDHVVAPLIESATGVGNMEDIACAPRVVTLHLGEVDLAADVELEPGPDESELLYARVRAVFVSRARGLTAPVAPVSTDLIDVAQLQTTTRRLRRLGFFGRACIHPTQVAIANAVFSPTAADLEWARSTLEDYETAAQGAIRGASGAMIDEAVVIRARKLLDQQHHFGKDTAPSSSRADCEHR